MIGRVVWGRGDCARLEGVVWGIGGGELNRIGRVVGGKLEK